MRALAGGVKHPAHQGPARNTTALKSLKVGKRMHFFLVFSASTFDAAADLAYKGYRIELRGFFVNALPVVFQAAALLV